MAINFFTLRQVTQLIAQKLEEAKRSVPAAYTAAKKPDGTFAKDIDLLHPVKLTNKDIAGSVTGAARSESSKKLHGHINTHLQGGRGVAVYLQKEPVFGADQEGELDRHYIVPHTDGHYLVSGSGKSGKKMKTTRIASMIPGEHGMIAVMPYSKGNRSASPIGYIPAGADSHNDIRTFAPDQVEKSGIGSKFKMRIQGGTPTLD